MTGFRRKGTVKEDLSRYYVEKNVRDFDMINHLALRIAFGDSVIFHQLSDGVVAKVKSTRICNMPNEFPEFLKKPFILEARHDHNLFDDVGSIAGYISDDDLFIIGNLQKMGLVQHIVKAFDGRNIDDINYFYHIPVPGSDVDFERKDLLAFVTIFALMLEAKQTPIVVDPSIKRSSGKKIHNGTYKEPEWIERRVYIDKRYGEKNKAATKSALNKDGKALIDVHIRGFLRRQARGPGHSIREWIWVDEFDSSRWVTEGDTRIIVDTTE
jgi:hypothetical protein